MHEFVRPQIQNLRLQQGNLVPFTRFHLAQLHRFSCLQPCRTKEKLLKGSSQVTYVSIGVKLPLHILVKQVQQLNIWITIEVYDSFLVLIIDIEKTYLVTK